MSRADYAHWNEEADIVWWAEEGRHQGEPSEEPSPSYEDGMTDWLDNFAEDCANAGMEELRSWLDRKDMTQVMRDMVTDEINNRS